MNQDWEDFLSNLSFEQFKYQRGGDHDFIHTLLPLESNKYIYAIPANSSKKLKYLVHAFFCSLDDDENLDLESLNAFTQQDSSEFDHTTSTEYLMADFIAALVAGASKDFGRAMSKTSLSSKSLTTSCITLNRLTATFHSAAILIKNGFFCETIYLFRALLEQIAYAYQCSMTEEDKLDKLKPSSSVSALKNKFKSAGKLYGYFSNFIHHDKNIWMNFLGIDESNDKPYILSRSGINSKENVAFMAFLAEMYFHVILDIYKKSSEDEDEFFMGLVFCSLQLINKIKLHFQQSVSNDADLA